jgi:hypothetical protein
MQNPAHLADRPVVKQHGLIVRNAVLHRADGHQSCAHAYTPAPDGLAGEERRTYEVRVGSRRMHLQCAWAYGRANAEILRAALAERYPRDHTRIVWLRGGGPSGRNFGRRPHDLVPHTLEDGTFFFHCLGCDVMENEGNLSAFKQPSELTTDCSGHALQSSIAAFVRDGALDYLNGAWIRTEQRIAPIPDALRATLLKTHKAIQS